jgi:hypothetical protein
VWKHMPHRISLGLQMKVIWGYWWWREESHNIMQVFIIRSMKRQPFMSLKNQNRLHTRGVTFATAITPAVFMSWVWCTLQNMTSFLKRTNLYLLFFLLLDIEQTNLEEMPGMRAKVIKYVSRNSDKLSCWFGRITLPSLWHNDLVFVWLCFSNPCTKIIAGLSF